MIKEARALEILRQVIGDVVGEGEDRSELFSIGLVGVGKYFRYRKEGGIITNHERWLERAIRNEIKDWWRKSNLIKGRVLKVKVSWMTGSVSGGYGEGE